MGNPDETTHHFHEIDAVLEKHGGFWTAADILDNLDKGTMQSFAKGSTWVITQVLEFPRKKVLDITFVYGNLQEARELESEVEEFARSVGAEMLKATGRKGWMAEMHDGWEVLNTVYVRKL
jgi:hypothetical protein